MRALSSPEAKTPSPEIARGRGELKAKKPGGFTLIELMIVVAIVAILTSVAYPSYLDHVKKGNRAQAQALLLDIAQRQQNYLINHRQYAPGLPDLGFSDENGLVSLSSDLKALSSAYDIAGIAMGAVSGPPPRFDLLLKPTEGSLQESDGALCLANTGARARHCGSEREVPW
jgi:type IV pilus assembly protein PilE